LAGNQEAQMELTIIRTGGIAGVHERLGPVSTDEVGGDIGGHIEKKVEEIGFFDLPAELPNDNRIIDGYQYELTIVASGDRNYTVRWADGVEEKYQRDMGELRRLLEETGAKFVDWPREGES
jgi:hypothetical protein